MIYYTLFDDPPFPDIFRAAVDACTSFSLFYFGTTVGDPAKEDLSKHRDLFLRRETNFIRDWPGMKGLHEVNFPATGETLKSFMDIVFENLHAGISCEFWQFTLVQGENVILWFQDGSECLFDTAHVRVEVDESAVAEVDRGIPQNPAFADQPKETRPVFQACPNLQSLNFPTTPPDPASAMTTQDLEALVGALRERFGVTDETEAANPPSP